MSGTCWSCKKAGQPFSWKYSHQKAWISSLGKHSCSLLISSLLRISNSSFHEPSVTFYFAAWLSLLTNQKGDLFCMFFFWIYVHSKYNLKNLVRSTLMRLNLFSPVYTVSSLSCAYIWHLISAVCRSGFFSQPLVKRGIFGSLGLPLKDPCFVTLLLAFPEDIHLGTDQSSNCVFPNCSLGLSSFNTNGLRWKNLVGYSPWNVLCLNVPVLGIPLMSPGCWLTDRRLCFKSRGCLA